MLQFEKYLYWKNIFIRYNQISFPSPVDARSPISLPAQLHAISFSLSLENKQTNGNKTIQTNDNWKKTVITWEAHTHRETKYFKTQNQKP